MPLEFIIEIGCEEIPARYIDSTLSQLRENLAKNFRNLLGMRPSILCHASSSGSVAPALDERQADRTELLTGPPRSALSTLRTILLLLLVALPPNMD